MISLHSNMASLLVQSNMKSATTLLNTAIERMTTGKRINHAKDDAAGFSIARTMASKLSSYTIVQDNASIGLDMVSTAEGSLGQIKDNIERLRMLQIQANNGTYDNDSLAAINSEANALVDEIDRIYNSTEFNGVNLLQGSGASGNFSQPITRRDVSTLDSLDDLDDLTQSLSAGTYSISTAKGLENLATLVNSGLVASGCEFVLGANIDLSDYSDWTPIGTSSKRFAGTFDGNGYTVSNLTINSPGENMQGLFGDARASTIKNLGVVNVDIEGNGCIGALVAVGGVVQNCYSSGEINANFKTAGGLIGQLNGTLVENCYSSCDVTTLSSQAGGLIASINNNNTNVTITNCYATGDVSAYADSMGNGGLLGQLGANSSLVLENCYSTSDVVGPIYTAGLIGCCATNSSLVVKNCYSTGNITGSYNVGGILSQTYDNITVVIDNCYTKCKTNATEADTNNSGFIGYITANTTSVEIKNSYMLGTLVNGSTGIFTNIAGGATATNILNIENCYYNPAGTSGASSLRYTSPDGTESVYEDSIRGEIKTCGAITPFTISGGRSMVRSVSPSDSEYSLQVGIDAQEASQLGISLGISLDGLGMLRSIGLQGQDNTAEIDDLLRSISGKLVEYGTASNRLESVMDSIQTQIETLTSSLSTVEDADVARESTEYLRQQILQNACATLLSTANQTPSIALALINGSRL